MPSSQQNVSAGRRFPQNTLSQLSSSSCADADASMQIPGPQKPKLARQLSPAEREDSIPKRKRPAEVNTVLTIVGVYNGNEIRMHCTSPNRKNFSTWTRGAVEVVDRPQSKQVLSTHWVRRQRLDGSYKMRIVARGFEQTVSLDVDFFYAGTPKVATLRGLLTIAAIHEIQLFSEIVTVRFINHRCRANQNQYVEPVLQAQVVPSKVWLCKKACQGS